MATRVLTRFDIEALAADSTLPFGPWHYATSRTHTQFFGTEITIAATTLAQIIGGVAPSVTSITTINTLFLYPVNQHIQVGLHGVNAQTAGFRLDAGHFLAMELGSINALSLYNLGTATASVIVAVGGP